MPQYSPSWQSLEQYTTPEWFRDAKFGIFIHWGVYSVPAIGNEWYPHSMYKVGSPENDLHTELFGSLTKFGYKDFIPQFKAEKFIASEWISLFKEAGAKYIVPVAEHHDGFAMYDCSYTKWNAVNMGPKRDVIAELAEATRDAGLTFGLSSHRAENWWFFHGGRNQPSDVQDPAFADLYGPASRFPENGTKEWHSLDWQPRPDATFLDDWLARTLELAEKYQPQLIWFDWWIGQIVFKPYLQKFAAGYYNLGETWDKGVVINYKSEAFEPGTAVWDIERGQVSGIRKSPWQNDTSVSQNSWGYIRNHVYKTPTQIITDLIDIVSKNGCLLLNVGPKPDGTIPDEEIEILREIGRWFAVNGEAIYGSRPWKQFGEGPTEIVEGGFLDSTAKAFTPQDIRFTTKENSLYAFILAKPTQSVTITSLTPEVYLAERINRITLLGTNTSLDWSQNQSGLTIILTDNLLDSAGSHAWVLKIETG